MNAWRPIGASSGRAHLLRNSMTGKPDSTYQFFDVSDEIQQFLTSPRTSSVYNCADRNDGAEPLSNWRSTDMVTTPAPIAGAAAPAKKTPKQRPPPNSEFYEFAETLNAEELAVLKQVRAFMETKVAPIINKYWIEDSFPFGLLPAFKELNIGGLGMQGYGRPPLTGRT
jgi:hypothetical protein